MRPWLHCFEESPDDVGCLADSAPSVNLDKTVLTLGILHVNGGSSIELSDSFDPCESVAMAE